MLVQIINAIGTISKVILRTNLAENLVENSLKIEGISREKCSYYFQDIFGKIDQSFGSVFEQRRYSSQGKYLDI